MVAVLALESFLFTFIEKRKGKIIFFCTVVLIAFIAGTRALSVGHDTANYANIYSNVILFDFKQLFTTKQYEGIEKGYMLFQWLFGKISHNPTHFYILIALFEFTVVGGWIWKNSNQPFLSFLIFICIFFTFFITGIRQSIAICILLLSYQDAEENKLVWFSVKVLIASMFHTTALVFFVVYFIKKFKNTGWLLAGSILLFPVIYFTRNSIFLSIIQLFAKYDDYETLQHGDAVSFTILLFMVAIAAFILKVYGEKSTDLEAQKYSFYCNLVAVAIMIMPFAGVNGALLRVAMYFFVVICLLVVKMYEKIPNPPLRLVVQIITISFLIFLFTKNVSTDTYRYEFIGWNNFL